MHWRTLEETVRKIANYKYGRPAMKDNIAGVDIDCLVKLESDHWIVIEISKEKSLQKWREDLSKFTIIRDSLKIQGIYCKCYFVTQEEPTQSVIDGARSTHVEALSYKNYEKDFFNYDMYLNFRMKVSFGSAVEPLTGNPDKSPFVPVEYFIRGTDQKYTLDALFSDLRNSKNVVVLGDYGTGKSRLVAELFQRLANDTQREGRYPIAINMRELWGVQRATEIVRRHFDDLALTSLSEPVLRMYTDEAFIIMLDGFDELGSQVWSKDASNLQKIRYESLGAVRDLVKKVKTGVLITGREHYFSNDEEMLAALGLQEDTLILECPDEFSSEAVQTYLSQLKVKSDYPKWLPRKPLICQIIANLDANSLNTLFDSNSGGYTFWINLISRICEREAKINPALDSETIKKVLVRLARYARTKPYREGPFKPEDLNRAFKDVVQSDPVEASATMLQRLATLGRVSGNSLDRQFVDDYILNGLQAEDVVEALGNHSDNVRETLWNHALGEQGLYILADALSEEYDLSDMVKRMHAVAKYDNSCFLGDIVGATLVSHYNDIDYKGLVINTAPVEFLDLSNRTTRNLIYNNCVISRILVSGAKVEGVSLNNITAGVVEGVTAGGLLPGWIMISGKTRIEAVSTVSRIKQADLLNVHRVLVTIIKKTFFQPGSGRQEEALLRGTGNLVDSSVRNRILNILISERILDRARGDSGYIYRPNRSLSARMGKILAELNQSTDKVWLDVKTLAK